MNDSRTILRTIGSLWFGAVLLMLLLVAMGAATVFESTHTAEHALAVFYKSWWFKGLLAMVGLNVLAAALARYPFSKRQIGFVMTHASLLMILVGAWVTEQWGVDGQIGLADGQSTREFRVDADTLTLTRQEDQAGASVSLKPSVFSGFDPVENPASAPLAMDGLSVEIDRYLPDSENLERMVDDNPLARPAVEVSLSPTGTDEPVWIFAEKAEALGPINATFRLIPNAEDLQLLISSKPAQSEAKAGLMRVEFQGKSSEIPLADCMKRVVPVPETGYSVRVLRYLPHAIVGPDREMKNASDQPVNPAVEVEVSGPEGGQKQWAFARFPDFKSMHGGGEIEGVKVTFVAPSDPTPTAPVEVLGGPAGELYVRFAAEVGQGTTSPITLGRPIPSPWPGLQFAVLRRFEHARTDRRIEPVSPVRKDRVPAILVKLTTKEHESGMWIQKNLPSPVTVNGRPYLLSFGDRVMPLGFTLKLDKFQVGYYPGERRPRSFESHVTIEDAASGRAQSRVISMNHPTKFAGYTLFQSSYRQEGGHSISFLSVSRDPGLPIVFAGYIGLMGGMVTALTLRIRDRRRMARLLALAATETEAQASATPRMGAGQTQPLHQGNGHRRGREPSAAVQTAHTGSRIAKRE